MLKKLCWCAIWCLTSVEATARIQEHWRIVPSTCIVSKSGDICRLQLTVQPPDKLLHQTVAGDICFVLQQKTLSCVSAIKPEIQISVEFNQPSLLEIYIGEQVVFDQHLDIQTLAPGNKRRRVRSPWSLF